MEIHKSRYGGTEIIQQVHDPLWMSYKIKEVHKYTNFDMQKWQSAQDKVAISAIGTPHAITDFDYGRYNIGSMFG